ncbi:MAG: ADOP family duplicated permease [Bryobacteraceae bacterium]
MRLTLSREILHDLRYAVRRLKRSPGFAIAVVSALGLGIGATTAIFSVIDEALLRPLPVPAPGELTAVYQFNRTEARYVSTSFPDYEDLSRARAFSQLAAYVRLPLHVRTGERLERVPVEAVTPNYFAMLQVAPLRGRHFDLEDGLVALISEDLWRERFQAGTLSHETTITIEEVSLQVIGVVPRHYRGTNLNWSDAPRVWVPIDNLLHLVPRFRALDIFSQRGMPWVVMLGRRGPGVSIAQAHAELEAISARLAREEPATNRDLTVRTFPAARSRFWPAYRATVFNSMAVFAGAAAVLLLLACANVSNLLLERALARRREIAVRLSLGASRRRIIRQLLAESMLLAAPSLAAAIGVARSLQSVLIGFPNAWGLGLSLELKPDFRVFAFSAALAVAATVLFSLLPAFRATRRDMLPDLRDSGNTAAPGRSVWQQALVVVQVALCMMLMVASGLFARSLAKAHAIDTGFHPENLLAVSFGLPAGRAHEDRGYRQVSELIARVAGIQGIESVAETQLLPLGAGRSPAEVRTPGTQVAASLHRVGPGYFATMGIPLIAGREFTRRDDRRASEVAIVSHSLAGKLWRGVNPVGQPILVQKKPVEIVGVAGDARLRSVWEPPEPMVYLASRQADFAVANLVLRYSGPPPNLRRLWPELAAGLPLYEVRMGEEMLNASLAPQRVAAGMLVAFGVVAVVLAALGLYSVMACVLERRRREVGIRIAIGARPAVVFRQVMYRALGLATGGVAAGAISAVALMRGVTQLREVSPHDVWSLGAAAVTVIAVACAAALAPAVRATRVDPASAMKCE